MEKIDFVTLWVDPSDKKWQKDHMKYSGKKPMDFIRYRDWDNLQYFFRGIEKNAPWVNKIYFITYGHVPKWLNTKNEKIVIVNHKDFIPKEYLPTFNSNVIEMNLWRIKELSNKFVLFNDDLFLTKKVEPTDFFIGDNVVDTYSEKILLNSKPKDKFYHAMFNNIGIINEEFNKRKFHKRNFTKVFNLKNGKKVLNTLYLLRCPEFTGFEDPHLCQAFKKEMFIKAAHDNKDFFIHTYNNKFRSRGDITQYLIRYKQLLSGEFINREPNFGRGFPLGNDNSLAIKSIINQEYKVICLNDSYEITDFEKTKKEIKDAFEQIYPIKSTFEK